MHIVPCSKRTESLKKKMVFHVPFFARGKRVNAKYFHQIRGFKVILLWVTMHQINKKNGDGGMILTGRGESGYIVTSCF